MFIPNTEKAFTYDYALPGSASNEQTYNQAVAGMIPRLFEVRLLLLMCPSFTNSTTLVEANECKRLNGFQPFRVMMSPSWLMGRRGLAKHTAWGQRTGLAVGFVVVVEKCNFSYLSWAVC